MSKQYRPWAPDQDYLLPPSPREWLPEDHLVYFLLDVIASLDLSAIEQVYQAKDRRGTQPYDPRMMTALLLYGYCVGVRSSRQLERATWEDVGFRVLAGDQHPDHTRIAEFRRVHLKALQGLFVQVLRLCQRAGLVKLGEVSLDGTKMAAQASKHKAMSHQRMVKREAELKAEIEALLAEAETCDEAEDQRFGKGRRGDELPAELARRESRLQKIQEAKAALEAEAANPPERAPDELPRHRVPRDREGQPKPQAQRNFTDPESRIMKRGQEFIQGYNCQVVVDGTSQVILAAEVTNQPPDAEHLRPLMLRVEANCGAQARTLLADAGYWSEQNAAWLAEQGIDGYLATEKLKHGEVPPCPRGRIPNDLDAKGRMRRKLRTKKGRETYARRKTQVEPVFGQIREAQSFGRFSLRGAEQASGEWSLACLAHNLRKLHRAVQQGVRAGSAGVGQACRRRRRPLQARAVPSGASRPDLTVIDGGR